MLNKIKKVTKRPKKFLNLFRYPLASISLYLSSSLYKKFDVKYRENPFKNTLNTNGLILLLNQIEIKITKKTISIEKFLEDDEISDWVNKDNRNRLSDLFTDFGSDKSQMHNYHFIYQPIIDKLIFNSKKLLISEIGLGTNNIDTLSNMGILGSPGASAKAFKNYDKKIKYFGGDIDKRILFQEDRIKTKYVDQLDIKSLMSFLSTENNVDLIIDDGLHTNHSNINFLASALSVIGDTKGKWIVIEDISLQNTPIWEYISTYLSTKYKIWLIKTKNSLMLVLLT
jgi:hypothetical protein